MNEGFTQWKDLEDLVVSVRTYVMEHLFIIPEAMVDRRGRVWGDLDLPRGERVLAAVDRSSRGVLDRLWLIDPAQARQQEAQLRRDAEAEGLIGEAGGS